jgi:hypothetical protein
MRAPLPLEVDRIQARMPSLGHVSVAYEDNHTIEVYLHRSHQRCIFTVREWTCDNDVALARIALEAR